MQEDYKILGLTENATDEEIENAYTALKNKYLKDRFLEGEAGNEAAKNLTKLENAYQEIKDGRKNDFNNGASSYAEIYSTLKKGDYNTAQRQLDEISYRGAEWHYLQSVIFYKKNWINESKKQLEIAIDLDPDNAKYKSEYEKLKSSMNTHGENFNNSRGYGGSYNQNANAQNVNYNNQQQMGGNGAMDFCECCATWCCMNMLCNSFCR